MLLFFTEHFLCLTDQSDSLACLLTAVSCVLCLCSGGGGQAGLGVRSGPGEAGDGSLQHPGYPAVLESGRALPQTVQSSGHPPTRLLPGRHKHHT